jgi:ActR/RegA family two-component response regulator
LINLSSVWNSININNQLGKRTQDLRHCENFYLLSDESLHWFEIKRSLVECSGNQVTGAEWNVPALKKSSSLK